MNNNLFFFRVDYADTIQDKKYFNTNWDWNENNFLNMQKVSSARFPQEVRDTYALNFFCSSVRNGIKYLHSLPRYVGVNVKRKFSFQEIERDKISNDDERRERWNSRWRWRRLKRDFEFVKISILGGMGWE